MNIKKNAFTLLFKFAFYSQFLLIVSCGTFPNTITQPTYDTKSHQYMVGNNPISYDDGYTSTNLPFEKSASGLKSQLLALRTSYDAEQQKLLNTIDFSNNMQFLGILVAAAGAAKNDTKLRNGGATAAGLSSLYTSHYQISIQAQNYKTASDAMECIYRKIEEIPDNVFNSMYEEGHLISTKPNEILDKESIDILSSLFSSINNSIYSVNKTLLSHQSSLALVAPSISDVQNSIEKFKNSDKKADDTNSKIAPFSAGVAATNFSSSFPSKNGTDLKIFLSRLIKLPAEVNLCSSAGGAK